VHDLVNVLIDEENNTIPKHYCIIHPAFIILLLINFDLILYV